MCTFTIFCALFPDIALLKLEPELIQTQHVAPIALNYCATNEGLKCHTITASGWGQTNQGGLSQYLMKGEQQIVKTDAVFSETKINEEYHLQGQQSPNGVGVCIGDSGGEP